jgi:hypothetical protein
MKRFDVKVAQFLELPRYLGFVWRACGATAALKAFVWTALSAPDIVRSGTLRAVDARLSRLHPPVRDAGDSTRWERVDFGLFRDILMRRCYWPDEAFAPRRGDTIVDLGANVGAYSILAAKRMGAGRVIAVEAQEYEHEMLVRNVALNGVEGIVTPLLGFAGAGGLFEGGEYSRKTIDIDAVVRERAISEITLLKADIEGSEFALFEQRPAWLRLVQRIAMEVHPPYGDVDALCATLRGEGFAVHVRPSATPAAAVYLYAERVAVAAAEAA